MTDPVREVYGRWDRFLNGLARIIGYDRELDQLSRELTDLRSEVLDDDRLEPDELDALSAKLHDIQRAYDEIARRRGYPIGVALQTSRESFEIYRELAQIHFETFAGKRFDGGLVGELADQIERPADSEAMRSATGRIALDILSSSSRDVALDKVALLRERLATVRDRRRQLEVMDSVGERLAREAQAWPSTVRQAALSPAELGGAMGWQSAASLQRTALPAEVRGTGAALPNRPIPGWEGTVRAAVAAGLDDLSGAGVLFLDTIPAGGGVKRVVLKVDLNLGADGPPSVTDPAATSAAVSELLERADARNVQIRLTVGDSAGGENIPLGRMTMDIARDTGNYHAALKSGLRFAAVRGEEGAAAALSAIEQAEARDVYFGSKDHRRLLEVDGVPYAQAAAELAALTQRIEEAASPYVAFVDFDSAGFTPVHPDLGPLGLAAWGTREFRMARPWVEADYRVHVSRGLSTHLLAGWTGATKGLIGLHAFGLRPMDQGIDKRGGDFLGIGHLLAQATGFASVFHRRTGIDIATAVQQCDDEGVREDMRACQSRWGRLMERREAWSGLRKEVGALADELRGDREGGLDEPALAERMRARMRAILDSADARSPGFRQAFWDGAHAVTRFVEVVADRYFRRLIAKEVRDEELGARIGLLTSLPCGSDLVIQSLPKIGLGGGPDAYHEVRDVGAIIVATDEPAADVFAWRAAGLQENFWSANTPVRASLRYRRGPMHADEIRDVSNLGTANR